MTDTQKNFLSSVDAAMFVHGKLAEGNSVHFAELVVVDLSTVSITSCRTFNNLPQTP